MVYFVRHGESESNVLGIFAGQKEDSILTEKGIDQATSTAKNILIEIPVIHRIISSPLKRALHTAEIIAGELNFDKNNIEIEKDIIEYDMGSLTGTPIHKISSTVLISAQNAENPDFFKKRVVDCVKELSKSSGNILIVSHAGVGRILETVKENIDSRFFYDLPAYPNASITKIDWL